MATQVPIRKALSARAETMFRAIPLARPGSVDDSARTVEVVFSTGAPVRRFDPWTGETWIEKLSLEDGHVDLSRLNNGAPVLDTHARWELADQIGVVDRAWLDKDGSRPVGRAMLRFPRAEDDPEVDAIFRKIKDGILRNISVGYSIRKMEKVAEEDGVTTMRAVDWQPHEISIVPVGADAGAGIRSLPIEGAPMSVHPQAAGDPASARIEASEHSDAYARGVREERERGASIRQLCRTAKLDDAFADDMITRGIGADHAGNHILEELARRNGSQSRNLAGNYTRAHVGNSLDAPEALARRAVDAIANKMAPELPLPDDAREFRAMSNEEIFRTILEARGERVRGVPASTIKEWMFTRAGGMHTTSDFPLIQTGAANKVLEQRFKVAQSELLMAASEDTAPDFREQLRLRIGEFPELRKVGEGGQITYGTMPESGEKFSLAEFARTLALSRQLLVNDANEAFGNMVTSAALAAANNLSSLLASAVINNPVMSDGKSVFHAAHNNLVGSGSGISVAGVGAARQKMRSQTGLDAKTILNIAPKFLVVPAALETEAQQLVTMIAAATQDEAPIFAGKLQVLTEARLDAASPTAWYLAADPALWPGLRYAYLDSARGPQVASEEDFDTMALKFRVHMDVAVYWADFRSWVRNPGGQA